MNNEALQKSSFFIKLVECCLVAFAIINSYNTLVVYLVDTKFKEEVQTLNNLRFFGMILVIFCVFFALVYPIVWQVKEKVGKIKSISHHTCFLALIRTWLAVMISCYAFAKIIGTQFSQDWVRNDSLAKDLSGFDLTWIYFGYSYPFSVIIGLLQLTGAILLLFRKTVFLGVCILLPVMLNIVGINYYYKISKAAQLNAIFFSIALLFLLSLFWQQIKNIISKASKALYPLKFGNVGKYIFRIIAIAYAWFFIYSLSRANRSELVGKWTVTSLIRGNDTLQATAWLTDSTAWKYVYLNESGRITANPNPYVIERNRAQTGKFHYDTKSHTLHVLFEKQKNSTGSFEFQITETGKNHMRWLGEDQDKILQIDLSRETDK
jgi:hypothetical protein